MDEPTVQYARTSDGADIAYWTMGSGPPLLQLTVQPVLPWRAYHSLEEVRAWDDRLAEHWTLVEFDARGVGLSAGQNVDHSLDACVADIEAVADAAGLGRFAIFAGLLSGPIAVAYAARHPDRVSHLILWCSFAAMNDYRSSPQALSPRAVGTATDWRALVTALWSQGVGWSHPDFLHRLVDVHVSSLSQQEHVSGSRISYEDDVTELLPSVETETLLIHREESMAPSALGRKLAAGLPNARLLAIDGDAILPFLGNSDLVLDTIRAFTGVATSSPADSTPQAAPSAFRTILFTDLESSTALTQAIGDAKAQDVLHGHNDVVRAALAAHNGEEVKHTGDGIMASFGSAVSAVEAALAIQRGLAGGEIRVRVGLNAGEPIQEEGDLFGGSVQLAARVCDRAEPGQVLVSNVVRELCTGKMFQFADQGEATLKGFPEPVRLFTVTPPEGEA